jgi:anti-anti-sigma factor
VPKQKIELTLPADLKFSSLVRRISEEFFLHAGFTKEWANRLKLVVDELFMNANRYGSKANEGKIYIFYQFDKDEVAFRIEDEGGGSKKVSAAELKKVIHKNSGEVNDLTKTCGRGLALISNLWTDGMTIEDSDRGGIAISFTKKIFSKMAPAPAPVVGPQIEVIKEAVQASPVIHKGPTEVVQISGEIDQSNMEEKVRPITEVLNKLPQDSVLVLDCKQLVYINSTFIGHLAAWLNQIQTKGGQMVLKNTNKQIREVLELVGLTKVIYLES